jgi:hypothetical protein
MQHNRGAGRSEEQNSRRPVAHESCRCARKVALTAGDKGGETNTGEEGSAHATEGAGRGKGNDGYASVQNVTPRCACECYLITCIEFSTAMEWQRVPAL